MVSMEHPTLTQAFGPTINRFADVMAHSDRFACHGTARLAAAAGVSSASVSRIVCGVVNPSFAMVARLTGAIEKELGFRIDPRDLVAERGRFLTRFTCDLVGCEKKHLPSVALDEFGTRTPAWIGVEPGKWVTSRYPKGYEAEGGM